MLQQVGPFGLELTALHGDRRYHLGQLTETGEAVVVVETAEAAVKWPGLPPPLASYSERGSYYTAFPRNPGLPLPAELPLHEEWAVALVCQLARQVGRLHRLAQPFYVGWLTPDVIQLIDGEPVLDLAAWAFSERPLAARTMAPGPQADVYALGSLLYALLSGAEPRPGQSLRRLNPKVSPRIAWLVGWCLHADPARRCPSAAELARQLGMWLKRIDEAVEEVNQMSRRPTTKKNNGLPVWAVYVGAAILAIALGGGVALIQQRLSAKPPAAPAVGDPEKPPVAQQPPAEQPPAQQPPLVSGKGAVEPSGEPRPPLPEPQEVPGSGPVGGTAEDVTDPDAPETPEEPADGETPEEPDEPGAAAILVAGDAYSGHVDAAGYLLATDLEGIFGVTVEQREGFGVVIASGGVEAQVADWYPAEDGSLYIRLGDAALTAFGYEYQGVVDGAHHFERVTE